jgi:signal peptidase I
MAKLPETPRHWIADWTVTGLLLLFGTTTLLQAFVVPTESMDTTIRVGDHLLVDKLAYAPAREWQKTILPYTEVRRGDVIVFQYPLDEKQNYVKRVIGVPGDRIRFVDNQLILNGKPVAEPYKRHNEQLYAPYLRNFPGAPPLSIIDRRARFMLQDHVRNGELLIPPGQYFALGDNRDNSADSRFWGLVPRENIIGKPILVWWSYDAPLEHWQPRTAEHVWAHAKDLALHFFTKTRWDQTFRRISSYPLH